MFLNFLRRWSLNSFVKWINPTLCPISKADVAIYGLNIPSKYIQLITAYTAYNLFQLLCSCSPNRQHNAVHLTAMKTLLLNCLINWNGFYNIVNPLAHGSKFNHFFCPLANRKYLNKIHKSINYSHFSKITINLRIMCNLLLYNITITL